MKLYTWNLDGFENAYSKYYYMPHLSSCDEDGIDEDGHFHATLGECGRASCICAFEDEMITYSRLFFQNDPIFKVRASKIVEKLNIPIGSSIFVGGCAFGYLMEALSDLKMNVYGCDNSPYIHFNTDTESIYPIHNVDLSDENFTNLIRESTGMMYFDYVISEDVLTSYDYYDVIFSNLQSILKPTKPSTNIIHFVETSCGQPFVKRDLPEWRLINENHTWLDFNGDE
jgi:hypothetical protein